MLVFLVWALDRPQSVSRGERGPASGAPQDGHDPAAAEDRMEPCSDWMVQGSLVRPTQCVSSSRAEKAWVPPSLVIFTSAQSFLASSVNLVLARESLIY